MKRLTEYKPTPNSMFPYKLIDDGANTELDAIHKLGRLEDLEEDLDMPLDKAVDLLFKAIKDSGFYDCLTCVNVMHNERGCDGNCSHNREFSRIAITDDEEEVKDKKARLEQYIADYIDIAREAHAAYREAYASKFEHYNGFLEVIKNIQRKKD